MDLVEKEKFDLDHFGAANHSNQPMGLVPMNDSAAAGKDSYCPNLWGHQSSQGLGCDDSNVGASSSVSNIVAPKGNGFLETASEIMPQSLSEFPSDSAFIERAARFSCFNGGSFSGIVNPFNISESLNLYSKDGLAIPVPFEILANGLKPALGAQSEINDTNLTDCSHGVGGYVDRGVADGILTKEREVVGCVRPHDETPKECNVPYEPEVSGSGRHVEPSMLEAGGLPSASKGNSVKKRKRTSQVTEIDKVGGAPQLQGETTKDDNRPNKKNDQNPTTTGKAAKHGKDSSPNSDAAKEDYIHVRARRGQATNSHSLAERVRREKISERMKFLQDLVPGCNKVTGKAVMLDEIINYVQSLQRQVEFLSMKLATVNPRLDLNIEELFTKDIHQSRGGPSMFPFSPDGNMIHTQLHPSQQGLIQAGIPGSGNPLDALRRPINSQLMSTNGGGYKDSSQIPNMWDEELNSVFPMNFGTNSPFNAQDLDGSLPSGHMKVEL